MGEFVIERRESCPNVSLRRAGAEWILVNIDCDQRSHATQKIHRARKNLGLEPFNIDFYHDTGIAAVMREFMIEGGDVDLDVACPWIRDILQGRRFR
jgi:hypothetical protein